MIGWTVTGLIFFLKPGYQSAYEQLAIKTYPLQRAFTIPAKNHWREARLIKSVLGYHLIVKTDTGTKHLDPLTLAPLPKPERQQLVQLLTDAFSINPSRYGKIESITGDNIVTSTGVNVTLYWDTMRLSQQGNDTKLINYIYQIHYLQWTPFKGFNQVIGIIGLALLLLLTIFGLKIYIQSRTNQR